MKKSDITLRNIEAYSMPSSTYVPNDSHCFVITKDRTVEWRNFGGGWSDSRPKIKVAENLSYKEWMEEFVPATFVGKCGIEFGINGVCHNFANRELLLGQQNVNVSAASKNYVCTAFFGKYGIGLKDLKNRLNDSYSIITVKYNDPYDALNKVLQRVDNYLDDELKAWRLVAIEYGGIPVDSILAKNPSGGINTARTRLQKYINEREALFDDYLKSHSFDFRTAVKKLTLEHSNDYLTMLCDKGYITSGEKIKYKKNIDTFLNKFTSGVEAQVNALKENGVMNLRLAELNLNEY